MTTTYLRKRLSSPLESLRVRCTGPRCVALVLTRAAAVCSVRCVQSAANKNTALYSLAAAVVAGAVGVAMWSLYIRRTGGSCGRNCACGAACKCAPGKCACKAADSGVSGSDCGCKSGAVCQCAAGTCKCVAGGAKKAACCQ